MDREFPRVIPNAENIHKNRDLMNYTGTLNANFIMSEADLLASDP